MPKSQSPSFYYNNKKFVFLILIVACFNWMCGESSAGDSSDKHISSAIKDSLVTDSSIQAFRDAFNKPDTANAYSISDTAQVGNFSYKIHGLGYNKTLDSEQGEQKADGVYLVVWLSYKNSGPVTQKLDHSEFTLIDKEGNEYNTSIEGSTALELSGDKIISEKDCPPKIQKLGYLCFEVPGKNIYYLQVPSKNGMGISASIRIPNKRF